MKVFSISDAEAFLKTGAREFRHGRNIMVTPSARDLLTENGITVTFEPDTLPPQDELSAEPAGASPPKAAAPVGDGGIEALFNSPEARALKQMICDIGHRCWQRDYNDGNGGNISARLGDWFLCTPTGVSKGFMRPEMICLVDSEGNQVAGQAPWTRTSEILSHLGIYRAVPAARSVCHAHPVHATAFAVAGIRPPQCLVPEVEIYVGTIPLAEYKMPGSPEMSEILGRLAPRHQSILMCNHGVITWGRSVEDAYFKMEITDSYCRMLWVAAQLPSKGARIPEDEMRKLLERKRKLGLPDEREGVAGGKLCAGDPFGFVSDLPDECATPAAGADALAQATPSELEHLVSIITEQVLRSLGKKSEE